MRCARTGTRSSSCVRHETSAPDTDSWDPAAGLVDPDFLAGADAVVCLSGVGVGAKRWTESYKQQILRSRVDSVGTLARSLAEYGGPRVLVCASAVGYYGDTGDRIVEEDAPAGASFLADVCRQVGGRGRSGARGRRAGRPPAHRARARRRQRPDEAAQAARAARRRRQARQRAAVLAVDHVARRDPRDHVRAHARHRRAR